MVAVLVLLGVVNIFKRPIEVVGNEVPQVIIFRVLPTLFHGVRFRSIRRCGMMPVGYHGRHLFRAVRGEISPCGTGYPSLSSTNGTNCIT